MDSKTIIWWEQSPDVYNKNKPRWYGEDAEDQQGGFDEVIKLDPKNYPPGTKVTVEIPLCPDCSMDQECCECGFDWQGWIDHRYQ